jgi:cyclopropane fatty-acyl-phospholipid synthase-like methyltransferase
MIKIKTDFPVAIDSNDHLFPWGTKRDNSTNNKFIIDIIKYFNLKKIKVLDLGASGGQLIKDFIPITKLAIGLEGSNYSIIHKRANWPQLYNKNLFTCDISKEFEIFNDEEKVLFECITAWEVVEHIKTDRLEQFFKNIYNHLADNGIFCCSVSMDKEPAYGGPKDVWLHETVWQKQQWLEYLNKLNLFEIIDPVIIQNRVRNERNSFQLDLKKKI